MAQLSAGILLYRRCNGEIEILLVHPGGPFWRTKDEGAWMIPKGMVEPGEEPVEAALREFAEELGTRLEGIPRPLCRIRQAGGKWVEAFAMEGDLDADAIISNEFSVEFPPKSGLLRSFPEVDRAAWFTFAAAEGMILPSQRPILAHLVGDLAEGTAAPSARSASPRRKFPARSGEAPGSRRLRASLPSTNSFGEDG